MLSVELLIGQDNAEAFVPLDVRRGRAGQPFAVRTLFGWCLNGQSPVTLPSRKVICNFVSSSSVDEYVSGRSNGPQKLHQYRSDLGSPHSKPAILVDTNLEVKKSQSVTVCEAVSSEAPPVKSRDYGVLVNPLCILIQQYPAWCRIKRVLAWCLMFVESLELINLQVVCQYKKSAKLRLGLYLFGRADS